MDTLGLINGGEKITCSINLFSGRENPAFAIESPASIAKIQGFLTGLSELSGDESFFSALGYNGFNLQSGAKTLIVSKGKISLTTALGTTTNYVDEGRQLERYLLDEFKAVYPELSDAIAAGF